MPVTSCSGKEGVPICSRVIVVVVAVVEVDVVLVVEVVLVDVAGERSIIFGKLALSCYCSRFL